MRLNSLSYLITLYDGLAKSRKSLVLSFRAQREILVFPIG
jgi:hypothetical protein